ncbi:MAG: CHRD domain-containing protein [Phycisphaerales bacterium]
MRISRGLAAVVAAGAACALAAPSDGAFITANFPLSGAQEAPPNDADAFGVGTIVVDTTAKTFNLDLFVVGIGLTDLLGVGPNSSPVHIHNAPAGANGPIVIDLGFFGSFVEDGLGITLSLRDIAFGGVQGGISSDIDSNLEQLFLGALYVNIHTNDFPGGEIRGQIVGPEIPTPGAAWLFALGGFVALRRRR